MMCAAVHVFASVAISNSVLSLQLPILHSYDVVSKTLMANKLL